MMKKGAILINTARGPVVDTRALLEALDRQNLAMAGLDVYEQEPLPADSALRSHPKVIATAHMAWFSQESQVQLQTTIAKEVVRVCTGGLPVSLANPDVLKKLGRFDEWTVPANVRWQMKRQELINRKQQITNHG